MQHTTTQHYICVFIHRICSRTQTRPHIVTVAPQAQITYTCGNTGALVFTWGIDRNVHSSGMRIEAASQPTPFWEGTIFIALDVMANTKQGETWTWENGWNGDSGVRPGPQGRSSDVVVGKGVLTSYCFPTVIPFFSSCRHLHSCKKAGRGRGEMRSKIEDEYRGFMLHVLQLLGHVTRGRDPSFFCFFSLSSLSWWLPCLAPNQSKLSCFLTRNTALSPQIQFLGSSQKNKLVNKDRARQGGSWVDWCLWPFNCSPADWTRSDFTPLFRLSFSAWVDFCFPDGIYSQRISLRRSFCFKLKMCSQKRLLGMLKFTLD